MCLGLCNTRIWSLEVEESQWGKTGYKMQEHEETEVSVKPLLCGKDQHDNKKKETDSRGWQHLTTITATCCISVTGKPQPAVMTNVVINREVLEKVACDLANDSLKHL